jgi:hypothetical protein
MPASVLLDPEGRKATQRKALRKQEPCLVLHVLGDCPWIRIVASWYFGTRLRRLKFGLGPSLNHFFL